MLASVEKEAGISMCQECFADSFVRGSSHVAPRPLDRETAPSSCQDSVSVLFALLLFGDTDGAVRLRARCGNCKVLLKGAQGVMMQCQVQTESCRFWQRHSHPSVEKS